MRCNSYLLYWVLRDVMSSFHMTSNLPTIYLIAGTYKLIWDRISIICLLLPALYDKFVRRLQLTGQWPPLHRYNQRDRPTKWPVKETCSWPLCCKTLRARQHNSLAYRYEYIKMDRRCGYSDRSSCGLRSIIWRPQISKGQVQYTIILVFITL